SGNRNIPALLGFWLITLVILVTLFEYWRGVKARVYSTGANFLTSLWNLTGKNRRRYGGYIIHLGVVIMGIGIIGIELFQTETQGTLTPGEELRVSDYAVSYKELAEFDAPDGRNVARAVLNVSKN